MSIQTVVALKSARANRRRAGSDTDANAAANAILDAVEVSKAAS
jgi:hypothetical protein